MSLPLRAEALDRRFGIAGHAQVLTDAAGLPKVQVTSPQCRGEMHLHGAQVTSWAPAGAEEVIFLSRHARWEQGKAIRGGIPICFPWFRAKADNPHAPAHGVVRTKMWALESVEQNAEGVSISMSTASDPDNPAAVAPRLPSAPTGNFWQPTKVGVHSKQH